MTRRPGSSNRAPVTRPEWLECEILRSPLNRSELKEPAVLVRRKQARLYGPNSEELVYVPGLPVISLFTGAGGLDIGCEDAGLCVVLQYECEAVACQTLIANRPVYFRHAALIQGDIRHTPTGMLLRESGLRVGECGVVIGGPLVRVIRPAANASPMTRGTA
jgi:hypothetical protein